ncbi:MAG: ABC transporter permease [Spirochaetota bacterium]
MMRTYAALFSMVFQQHLQYRVAAVAGAVTNIAFGFFRLFLLTAFYRATDAPQPMALPELYSYLWFGQVMFSVMPILGILGPDAEEIRTGDVAYRLTRPVSIFSFYFARVLGQKTTALCTRSAIQLVALIVLFPLFGIAELGMRPPELGLLPLLVVSLAPAVLLSAAIHTFIHMTGFWTISTRGSATVSYSIIALFSGLLVPLAFFPPVIGTLARFLPFRGIYDTPATLYNGTVGMTEALLGIGHQIVWICVVVALGNALARAGAARLEIAGG